MIIKEFDAAAYRDKAKAAILSNNFAELKELKRSYGKRHVHLETYIEYNKYESRVNDYVTVTPALREKLEHVYFHQCKVSDDPEFPEFLEPPFTPKEVREILANLYEEY